MTREWSVQESAKLGDVIAVAIRAVIAGADNRVDIETFGGAIVDRFETFREFPNGIPSRDAFGRVFSLIDARNFQGLFIEWTKRVWEAAEGQVAAIDGETVRRSANRGAGEHERRGDDRVHAVGGRQDFGSQAVLHNESAGSGGSDSGGCPGALGS